jgi:hypothetical protein
VKNFWSGFIKSAYDFEHEARRSEQHYDYQSKRTNPMSKVKAALYTGLAGALLGGAGGALHDNFKGNRLLGGALGAGLGALAGGGLGILTAMVDKLGIETAKRIMAMPKKERDAYLKYLAYQNEITDKEYKDWSKELAEERRHDELLNAMKNK